MQSCEFSFKKVEKNLCYFLIFWTRSTAVLTILLCWYLVSTAVTRPYRKMKLHRPCAQVGVTAQIARCSRFKNASSWTSEKWKFGCKFEAPFSGVTRGKTQAALSILGMPLPSRPQQTTPRGAWPAFASQSPLSWASLSRFSRKNSRSTKGLPFYGSIHVRPFQGGNSADHESDTY